MIDNSQFRTKRKIGLIGNAVTKLKNKRTQFMDLTSSQSEAIRYILKNHHDREITAANLMENLRLSQSTVAGIIKRLEGKDLIVRRVMDNDNRKSVILPTKKGLKLDNKLRQTAAEVEEQLVSGMTDNEIETFNMLLQKTFDNITKENLHGNQ